MGFASLCAMLISMLFISIYAGNFSGRELVGLCFSVMFFLTAFLIDSKFLCIINAIAFTTYRVLLMLSIAAVSVPLAVAFTIGINIIFLISCILAASYWWLIFKYFKKSAIKHGW